MKTEKTDEKLSKDAEAEQAAVAEPVGKPLDKGEQSLRARLLAGESPIHNFKGNQQETWQFFAQVTGAGGKKVADSLDDSIILKNWYVHNIEMEDRKTGEITTVPRAAMVAEGGEIYTSVSMGIIDALDQIRAVFGDGPYNGQVKFKVRKVPVRSGGNTYSLEPIA